MQIDAELKKWATNKQSDIIDAVNKTGGIRCAARELNIPRSSIQDMLRSLKRKAALAGYAPDADMIHPVPDPFIVRGTSTLYDEDGKARLQWVKTKLDETKAREAIEEWVRWLVEDARGLAPAIAAPKHCNSDLLSVYPIGDPHLGMKAWEEETGETFDLKIAEELMCSAIDRLIVSAPDSEQALILELGDFFHVDNNTGRTERSGAQLDVDTRWAKMLQVGLRTMIYTIKRTLGKHRKVTVRIVQGNHDRCSAYALTLGLDAYFHEEPRVNIELSPAPQWYFRFGKVLIGTTHGDMCKPENLPAIMASDRAKDWGETEFRYYYHGHIHTRRVIEAPGCLVESFRTLAARDAWHAAMGYRSGRDISVLVHHRLYGEIERHRVDVAMLSGGGRGGKGEKGEKK